MHHITHKSGGVVILDGFGIAECFQNGVSLQQLVFKFTLQYVHFEMKNTSMLARVCMYYIFLTQHFI